MFNKIFLSLTITSGLLLASTTYKAKVLPIHEYSVVSEGTGTVDDITLEELSYNNGYIKLDNSLLIEKLNIYKKKLVLLQKKIEIKTIDYNNALNMNSISESSKNSYYLNLVDLKMSELDLKNTIIGLEDSLKKTKYSNNNNLYIKELLVSVGEWVSVGKPILKVEDHGLARIEFYVEKELLAYIKEELLKTPFKIEDIIVSKSTDETYVSSYKVILTTKDSDFIGEVVDIEVNND